MRGGYSRSNSKLQGGRQGSTEERRTAKYGTEKQEPFKKHGRWGEQVPPCEVQLASNGGRAKAFGHLTCRCGRHWKKEDALPWEILPDFGEKSAEAKVSERRRVEG
ncbi:hypothetical protein [Xanthovirga aplysinae]|uniref:hypothetical protein n=1 Tax=Xanthovirga aplysinae TaxID=2529853 RepID=UPI0012BC6B4F|nr:hypothetical protein [Xanthovirga aplysinae]MTI31125.1 hypothetical protein [Xanthovirga aplysinae]